MGRLIAAGAESAVAGAGKHDRADVLVIPGLVEGADQLVASLAAERIHLVRAVDDDPGDAVARFIDQVFVGHLGCSLKKKTVSPRHRQAAGDAEHLAGDESRIVAGEEQDRAGQVFRLTNAPHRDGARESLDEFFGICSAFLEPGE